ncbi:MAG: homoserine O-acetyltransferase, partial [Phycisphaerae bacterium]|nr:homoserine O-acetyltransferase [Phycisphaerae bacterium]
TTGPNSINPETASPYAADFPDITIADIVQVQRMLVEHLGIEKLLAVVGGSMGGHQALAWGTQHSDSVCGVVLLATSPRLSSQSLAFDIVGRNAIRQDPNFRNGQYYDEGPGPDTGLALARMLGHITYLSPSAMSRKFGPTRDQPRDVETDFEKDFSVGSYLAYKGQQFTQRFDANSYVTLSMAMDQFDIGDTPGELIEAFSGSTARWLVISYSSDWLFPSAQSRQMVDALIQVSRPVSYCDVTSHCGHDAFLLEDTLATYGELTRAFLANLCGEPLETNGTQTGHHPTSIFHHARRLDYDRIVELIPPTDSVLDLGCGEGGLLANLKQRGHGLLRGVELDEKNILACVRRGLDVVQEDLNNGLKCFSDNQFDFVVLSQTLQAVYDVEGVIDEMLRVGRRGIVSVPNFAYYKLQDILREQGRTPEAGLLHFKWYNTPNIRVLTLKDFEEFCRQKGIRIHKRVALDTEAGLEIRDDKDPNRNADMAIFVVSR